MHQNRCSSCGKDIQGLDLYFEQRGGVVCLECVVERELPLDLPGGEVSEGHPEWGQPQLERCLDEVMGRPLRGPLLEPVEFMYKG